ncbi:MAG: biopolymer transporter ExbD [Lentimicrobiaceae bacterium]|jgi:biopolymer transport protein ExbD|nr:biopolymer transporter ExbD [Lentimicrobiaceae bacterium]
MPKIKLPTKSPHIDMTPLVDLFSLLLTFFMLTASFRPQEAATVDSPSSISEKQAPDNNIMTLLVDKEGKVFFNFDNGKDTTTKYRADLIQKIGEYYQIKFTKEEIGTFAKYSSFGMPIKFIKTWLHTKDSKKREEFQTGIPYDSTDNQLLMWIRFARIVNLNSEVAIKADAKTDYIKVKKVMDMLQENKVNRFNLVTNLQKEEAKPEDIK